MISVIIPAHNEEAVISRCLAALADGAVPVEIEIVVVANGCTDRTADIARSFSPSVRVIETPVASKVAALNLGDAAASGFPRFYVDADVVIPFSDLRRLARELESRDVLAIAPLPVFDVAGCGWSVRAYYAIHQRLPAYLEGIGGSGVYGISEAGRRRFAEFPEVTADDGFVRLQFAPTERRTPPDCHSTVFAPKTLRELVAIKARSCRGTNELKQRFPEQFRANIGTGNSGVLRGLMLRPWVWPKLGAYVYVKLMARRGARQKPANGNQSRWERDETSRSIATEDSRLAINQTRDDVAGERPTRVLAVASGGGHWVQLRRAMSAFATCDVAFVTVNSAYQAEVPGCRFHCINDATRWDKIGLVRMLVKLLWILVRERPDVIVSTGAAPGYFALRIGKLLGARTIWLDSIANVEQLSMSGQRVGRYADLWLTQWPHLARAQGPHFAGAVL